MAVTHADLAVGRSGRSLGSKLGNGVMVLCTLLGLLSFIFCLIAETTRSEAMWLLEVFRNRSKGVETKCMYSGNGRSPVLCASGGILSLGMSLGIQQAYLWMALCRPPATDRFHPLAAWTSSAFSSKSLTLQAAFFVISSWVCFAVAAVLLLIGIGVEASHLGDSEVARNKCLVIRPGMFAAAGVFGLSAVSLGAAFYVTALQTQRLQEEEANVRQEVLEATVFSAGPMDESPPLHESPPLSAHAQPRQHHDPAKISNVP